MIKRYFPYAKIRHKELRTNDQYSNRSSNRPTTRKKILDQAVQNYKHYPEYETFIIVPNHIKFTTEVRAINKLAVSEKKG